jgi:sensory rhodopsin
MPDGMIVPATTIYFGTAALLGIGGLLVAALGLRTRGRSRRICLVAAVPALAMAVAYVFMGMEWVTVTTAGREQSVMRFVGYTLAIAAFVYVIRVLLDLSRRTTLVLVVVLWLQPWFSLSSWVAPEPLATLSSLGALVGTLLGAYALFVPITRRAGAVTGESRLLYAKLRNLFVLCTGLLVVQALISEQAFGLTNLFVGQIAASYIDLVLELGIGLLVLSGRDAFETGETEQPGDEPSTDSERETVTAEPVASGDR